MQKNNRTVYQKATVVAALLDLLLACNNKNEHRWVKVFDSSKNLRKEYVVNLKNEKDGAYKEYYSDGTLKNLYYYSHNQPNGEQKSFYENGDIRAIGYYMNSKLDSIQKWYYRNSILKHENYRFDGILFGVQKDYDYDGKINCTYFMADDSTKVASLYFDSTGVINKKNGNLIYCVYNSGLLHVNDSFRAIFYVMLPPHYKYNCQVIEKSESKMISRTQRDLEEINNNYAILIEKKFSSSGQYEVGVRVDIDNNNGSKFSDSSFVPITIKL